MSKISLIVNILIIVALVAGATVVYNHIYERGYQAADAEAKKRELAQKEINDRAIAAAEKRLQADLDRVAKEKELLENEIIRLAYEAAEDPAANDGALSADSVRRLNSIR